MFHTASTWGEFVDRLNRDQSADFVDRLFVSWDGLENFFSEETGYAPTTQFAGWDDIKDEGWMSGVLPLGGGDEAEPYWSWEDDMPEEVVELADVGSTMVSEYCNLT